MMSENIWNCECGQTANSGKFCINCGKKKPVDAFVMGSAIPSDAVEVKPIEAEPVNRADLYADPVPRTEEPLLRNAPVAEPYSPLSQMGQPYYQTNQANAVNNSYYAAAPVNNIPKKTSSASLVLGIFSLVCLFIQPLGIILAIIGLINSRKGGTAGKVMCIIGLIIGILFLLLDLFLAFLIMVSK